MEAFPAIRMRCLESTARPGELHLRRADVYGLRADEGGYAAVDAVEGAGCAAGGADFRDAGSVDW